MLRMTPKDAIFNCSNQEWIWVSRTYVKLIVFSQEEEYS
uniref:Uncharacterized protein n=1 Tax=Rhizophora mucronata TaxID=61149 RepID=A0A2P2QAU8_RHIMU